MTALLSKCCGSILQAANGSRTKARCSACGVVYNITEVGKADKWTQLRNWLTNLHIQKTTKNVEKIGIETALRLMTRIEEMGEDK